MITNINPNIFNLRKGVKLLGLNNLYKYKIEMYNVYKENNCLDLFLNYYGNYFACEYLVEQAITPLLPIVKMFIYAYTLEEKEKSFYLFINNDLRSGNPKKIGRYLPMINMIYDL